MSNIKKMLDLMALEDVYDLYSDRKTMPDDVYAFLTATQDEIAEEQETREDI